MLRPVFFWPPNFLFMRLAGIVMVVAGAAALNGCGGQAADQVKASDAPVRIRWARDPETLDPYVQPNQNATDAQALLGGSLLGINPRTHTYDPFLARQLPTVSTEGDSLTQLRYAIRPEARWDDGHPITGHDVAFTLKLLNCPDVPNEAFRFQVAFVGAVAVDAVDARQFVLRCPGLSPDYVIASGDFSIVPEAVLDPQGALRAFSLREVKGAVEPARRPRLAAIMQAISQRYAALAPGQHPDKLPGCGPYRLAAWTRDQQLVFKRKHPWWGDSVAGNELMQCANSPLEFRIMPEDGPAALALRAGRLDVYPGVPARTFENLRHSAGADKLAFYTSPSYEVVTAGYNTARPALHDAATRHALAQLFDAARLCQNTQFGHGQLTVGLISPEEKGRYNDSLPLIPYSPGGATAALARAGWRRTATGWQRPGSAGPLHLRVRYRAGEPTYELVALQFAAAARAAGVGVELLPAESGLLRKLLQQGDFDMYVQAIKGNPFLFNFEPLFGSRAVGENNLTRYGTPQTDRFLQRVAAGGSPAEQAQLLRRFQRLLRDDLPLVEQALAFIGQGQLPRAAGQQADPQCSLEAGNVVADHGRREVQLAGSGTKRFGADDGCEDGQCAQVIDHRTILDHLRIDDGRRRNGSHSGFTASLFEAAGGQGTDHIVEVPTRRPPCFLDRVIARVGHVALSQVDRVRRIASRVRCGSRQ